MAGLIGQFILCIFGKLLIVGAGGFKFTYFHFSSLWIICTQSLIRVPYLFLESIGEVIVYCRKMIIGNELVYLEVVII